MPAFRVSQHLSSFSYSPHDSTLPNHYVFKGKRFCTVQTQPCDVASLKSFVHEVLCRSRTFVNREKLGLGTIHHCIEIGRSHESGPGRRRPPTLGHRSRHLGRLPQMAPCDGTCLVSSGFSEGGTPLTLTSTRLTGSHVSFLG
ncbi:hypothetical protein PAXRUDRAFT_835794 [Paxillus rubicundulus Ve08.2h10]|uniref:Uncharacterized protein n=1 Tax=Paxillus rubicundulus Ve08.2h10 TaxID=930991 RepID=A0A0D0BUP7_9AGAM|nr:hypothetical protein PAXRUDRAFT_835794 [Paxillus rubicundulus Ve08.2h10]